MGADLECLEMLLPSVFPDGTGIEDPRGFHSVADREIDVELVVFLHVACPFRCMRACHASLATGIRTAARYMEHGRGHG